MSRRMQQTISLFTLGFILLFTPPVSAHWEPHGPFGGSVKCLAVIDTFVYVGAPEGGLYRSTTRNAVAWKNFNAVMMTGNVNAIAGMGTTVIVGSADQGIFISTDNGVTWNQRNNGLTNYTILSLHVSGTTIYAGTSGGGVFKSTNSGDSWTALNSGLSNLTINTLTSANVLLVAGTNGGGVFYSTDGGSHWTAGNTGLTNLTITSLSSYGTTLFASTKGGGIFSVNEFFTWSAVNTGLTHLDVKQVIISGSTAYAATAGGVFTSSASSFSWTAQNTGLPADTINALAVFDNKLISGTAKSGVYISPLGAISWTERNTGFNNLKTYALYANGSLIIAATEKGIYVSRDLAVSYTLSNTGLLDSLNVTCLTFVGTKLFAGTKTGVYQSADTGKTWQSSNLPNYITSMIASNNKLIVTTISNASVYMTPVSSIQWILMNAGFQSNTTIVSLAANGDDIYAGTNSEGIYVLKSGAPFWTYFNNGMNNQHVSSIVIMGDKIVGATPNNGVFVSNLSSASWSLSNNGLPDVHITSLGKTGPYILAGYKGGVYASSDNGASWQAPNVLLHIPPYAHVTNIAFSADRIFITTPNNSVYSNAKAELPPLTTTSIFDGSASLNNSIRVSPNPNNGTFKLDYTSLNIEVAEVSIYDHSGKLMETFNSGEKLISVNYPQGMYTIHLKTKSNEVMTQKMILQ